MVRSLVSLSLIPFGMFLGLFLERLLHRKAAPIPFTHSPENRHYWPESYGGCRLGVWAQVLQFGIGRPPPSRALRQSQPSFYSEKEASPLIPFFKVFKEFWYYGLCYPFASRQWDSFLFMSLVALALGSTLNVSRFLGPAFVKDLNGLQVLSATFLSLVSVGIKIPTGKMKVPWSILATFLATFLAIPLSSFPLPPTAPPSSTASCYHPSTGWISAFPSACGISQALLF